jgi:hypothetical protein
VVCICVFYGAHVRVTAALVSDSAAAREGANVIFPGIEEPVTDCSGRARAGW